MLEEGYIASVRTGDAGLPAGEAVEGLPGHLVGEGDEGQVHRGGGEF